MRKKKEIYKFIIKYNTCYIQSTGASVDVHHSCHSVSARIIGGGMEEMDARYSTTAKKTRRRKKKEEEEERMKKK